MAVVVPKASNPAGYPGGTVTVTGLPGGPVTADLELGSAMVALPATTPAGSHTLTVTYAGEANHAPSSSAPLTLTVAKATPRVTVSGLDAPGPYGTAREVTVSVDGGATLTGAITVTGVPGGTLTGQLAGTGATRSSRSRPWCA